METTPLLVALADIGKTRRDPVYAEAEQMQTLLRESAGEVWLEAVPPEMMELFTDQQWPELVFQFQPSLRLFEACNDIVSLHRQADASGSLEITEPEGKYHWLIFCRAGEQLIRSATPGEYHGLLQALGGRNFGAIAAAQWPNDPQNQQYHRMTDMLLVWLKEGLIIDAGVPLPADARFEDEPDTATQSYASSQGPESESR